MREPRERPEIVPPIAPFQDGELGFAGMALMAVTVNDPLKRPIAVSARGEALGVVERQLRGPLPLLWWSAPWGGGR